MQGTPNKFFRIVGKITLDEVTAMNGVGWGLGFKDAKSELERKYPEAKTAVIQGSKAHQSTKDPNDEKDVITLGLYSEGGSRIASAHIHEDGTVNDWPSRFGRK